MELRYPQPTDPRDPHAKTWTWKTGIGKDAVHQFLHLESGVFYSRQNISSASEVESLQQAVKHTHPIMSLQPADMLHVDSIVELRYAPSVRVVELDHGDPTPFTMLGIDFGEELFEAVRKSMTVPHRIEEGTISVWSAIQMPAALLLLALALGGIFTVILWADDKSSDALKYGVPFATAVLSLLFGVFTAVRAFNPPKAQILRTDRK